MYCSSTLRNWLAAWTPSRTSGEASGRRVVVGRYVDESLVLSGRCVDATLIALQSSSLRQQHQMP